MTQAAAAPDGIPLMHRWFSVEFQLQYTPGNSTSFGSTPLPPIFLIRLAVSLVWLYEGFWPKIMGRLPHQESVVESVPFFGSAYARSFLLTLGFLECALGLWLLSGWQAWWAALFSTVLLIGMNSCGLLWGREHIHDPGGMLVKNFTLIILTWVAAGLSAV